jgi:sugar lactone lactonase YvrE
MNDGSCDPAGRLFAGTVAISGAPGRGTLYRLGPALEPEVVLSPVTVSNGIDWSPDASLMYYIDSPTRAVDVFDYDITTGTPSRRRTLVAVGENDGVPDGLTVDADGYVWVAFCGGWCVRRYAPDGQLERVVQQPVAAVTACAFGGPELNDLYVTTASEGLTAAEKFEQPMAGALFRVSTDVRGKAGFAFRG